MNSLFKKCSNFPLLAVYIGKLKDTSLESFKQLMDLVIFQ